MQELSRAAPDPSRVPLPRGALQGHLCPGPFSHGISKPIEARTTSVMVRNVPCGTKVGVAMQTLDNFGFAGTYDFFYLPMNSANKANLGYFFVNFMKPEDATRCSERLTGISFGSGLSKKRCEVSAADIQGSSSLIVFFKRKAVLHSMGPPLFFAEGVPLTSESLAIQVL